jgi:hypothetical protein
MGYKVYTNSKGQYHREDGPAVDLGGGFGQWWINDKLHRLDGPAIIWEDGDGMYYIDGIEYSYEDFTMYNRSIRIKSILNHQPIDLDIDESNPPK